MSNTATTETTADTMHSPEYKTTRSLHHAVHPSVDTQASARASVADPAVVEPEVRDNYREAIPPKALGNWAVACVLYECLTGEQPFPGNTLEQVAIGHLFTPPPQSLGNEPHPAHRSGPGDRHRPGQATLRPLPHCRRNGSCGKASHHRSKSGRCRSAHATGSNESERSKLAGLAATRVDAATSLA